MCAHAFQLHLYDVDVPGKITFQESRFLSPGNEFFTFETGMLIASSWSAYKTSCSSYMCISI